MCEGNLTDAFDDFFHQTTLAEEDAGSELIVLNKENCEMNIRVVDFNFICCAHINRAMNREVGLKKFTMFGGWLSPNKPHLKFFRPS